MSDRDLPARPVPMVAALAAESGAGVVLGLVGALLFGFGSGTLLVALGQGQNLGMGLLAVMVYAAPLGYAVGAAAGVALAGRWFKQRGSWWLALLGISGGVVPFIVLALTIWPGDQVGALLGLAAVLSLGLALLGYIMPRLRGAA